jgi:geranylgeranyl reductase family protein
MSPVHSDANNPATAVAIVGGGPAGLFAARALARAGIGVDLFEEHREIGEPVHCTGVLAREAFDDFSLSRSPVLNELRTVRFFAPSGDTVQYSTPAVEAVVIDRAKFDQRLAAEAEEAGARLHRARVTALQVHRHGVTVCTRDSVLHARASILACGASYALQRKLGLGMPQLMLNSAQMELPADEVGPVEVHFGSDLAPGGFAWAVPVERPDRTSVRIGVMCEGDAARYFRQILETVRDRWGVRLSSGMQPRQKVLPLGPIARTYADRVLVLGDAAGLVKPTTGGGIYYSLVSAQLAADTLLSALADDDLGQERLASYEAGWRKRLGRELRWQQILRGITQALSDTEINSLFELARTDGIMPIVRRTAAFNHHREFIVALLKHPPARRVLFRAALA